MQAQIDENYKIASDSNNFILQERRVAKEIDTLTKLSKRMDELEEIIKKVK